jgi:hypothetical protein
MASFFDADKFAFIEMADGHKIPVHYRELGEKEGHLYPKAVSWADATINNVPLEQTFQFEDEISHIEETFDNADDSVKGVIIVNERSSPYIISGNDEDSTIQKKKWMNRLEKMTLTPLSLPEAKKKKKGHERYPVKPKCKKEVRDEKIYHSAETFNELIDEKDIGILGDHIYTIRVQKNVRLIPTDDTSTSTEPLFTDWQKTFVPPEHWLTPKIQWDKIWSEMDKIEHGYNREFIYLPEGETYPGSIYIEGYRGPPRIEGPAMKFFDFGDESDNYACRTSTFQTMKESHEIPDASNLTNSSYLSRVEKEYILLILHQE